MAGETRGNGIKEFDMLVRIIEETADEVTLVEHVHDLARRIGWEPEDGDDAPQSWDNDQARELALLVRELLRRAGR